MVYGILEGPSELMSPVDCTASLKGQILNQPLEYSIPFEVPGNSPSFPIPIIHHLAAKALIKDWERDGGNKKSEIVKLSIESSVVSSHTAFVAIDESNQPVRGAMKTWDITASTLAMSWEECEDDECEGGECEVEECEGGGGIQDYISSCDGKGINVCHDEEYTELAISDEMDDRCVKLSIETCKMKEDISFVEKEYNSSMSRSSGGYRGTTDSLSSLISLQQADGSWKLNDVIAKVLSKSLKELSDACPVKCDGGVATLWATILCVVYLELKHPSQKDEWELIAMKAELWLDGQSLPAGADLNTMKAASRKIIA